MNLPFKLNYNFRGENHLDYKFSPLNLDYSKLPKSIDLEKLCFDYYYNQLTLGACQSNAGASLIQASEVFECHNNFAPSRLVIYRNARITDDLPINEDTGASIHGTLKGAKDFGYCSEKTVPYEIEKFANDLSQAAIEECKLHSIDRYEYIDNNLNHIKSCLANQKCFALGIKIFASFKSEDVYKTGLIPMPKSNEELLGGHAIVAIGYDDDKRIPGLFDTGAIKCRNSWGADWGDHGNFWLPYRYVTDRNLADDFWKVNLTK